MSSNIAKPFKEYALFLMQWGSLTLTFTVVCLAMRIKQAATDFIVIMLVGVRCAVTFLVLYLVDSKTAGFELIDPK